MWQTLMLYCIHYNLTVPARVGAADLMVLFKIYLKTQYIQMHVVGEFDQRYQTLQFCFIIFGFSAPIGDVLLADAMTLFL